jgi:hypothetical protein
LLESDGVLYRAIVTRSGVQLKVTGIGNDMISDDISPSHFEKITKYFRCC